MDSPSGHLQAQQPCPRSSSSSYSSQFSPVGTPWSPSSLAPTTPLSSPALSAISSSPSPGNSSSIYGRTLPQTSFRSSYLVTPGTEDRNRAFKLAKERSSSNTGKGATVALSDIINGTVANSTTMLVRALLDLGADVCFERRKSTNVVKAALNKDQVDVRSDLLDRATRNCSHDILMLLAQRADEEAVNQALPTAIEQDDEEKVMILLARGADASSLCSQFLKVIESGSDTIVDGLTRTTKGACQKCRDKGLVLAAKLGYATKVQILLDKGADPNFEKAHALSAAVSGGREDICRLIVSGKPRRVHSELLDAAIRDAYTQPNYEIIRACLQARGGSPSETINWILLQAVECHQFDLAALLLRSNASVEYQDGAVVAAAVMSGHYEVLQSVVSSGRASHSSMAAAIARVTELDNLQTTGQMIDVLLSAGLRGNAVNETLLRILDSKFVDGDEDSRWELARLLLEKGGADVNFQNGRALVLAAEEGWMNILRLFTVYRPSFTSCAAVMRPLMRHTGHEVINDIVNIVTDARYTKHAVADGLRAAAVSAAAEALRLDVLQDIVQPGVSDSTILTGLSAAISSGCEWVTPSGLLVIQFFLDNVASGPIVDEAFCRATKLLAQDAIHMLSDFISEECGSNALLGLIENSREWHSPDDQNIWLIQSLIQDWGAHGEPVNIALLYALEAYTSNPKLASKALVETLLPAADVNFRHGEALKIAIKGGDLLLLDELAACGASEEAMTHAFRAAVIAKLEEEKVLEVLKVLNNKKFENRPDFKRGLPSQRPPIFDCLEAHPESVKLLKRLIKLGCEVDAKTRTRLYHDIEPEDATALAWALSRGKTITSAVITVLIDEKANVNFTSQFSQTTPLILAAKNRRGDIVKKLLEAKANSRSHDRFDKAALFYASQVGDITAVKALLKTEFRMNDGSLHEAARNLHRDCVAALIGAKYDPNFRSSREEHNGRNALQEMAFRCSGSQNVPDMEATIWALEKGGANPLEKWRGKSALFLALSNPQPYCITQAFLNTGKWCKVNDSKNVFEETQADGTKLYFSLSVYLRRYIDKGNATSYLELEKLLRTMECVDRYFAGLGSRQPHGAVGLPKDIAEEVHRLEEESNGYWKAESDHQTKIRRKYEESEAQHRLWQEQQAEKTAQKINDSTTIHETQLHQNMQMSSQQQNALAQKNAIAELSLQRQQHLKLDFQQQTGQQKLGIQQQQNTLTREAQQSKVAFQQAQNRVAQSAQNQKIATQGKQNDLRKENERQKVLYAKRMQAIKSSEERQKLKAKKAGHKEDLSFLNAKASLNSRGK
ncbi:hypothetical protein F5Y07DRAFT_349202 [Xylaria sp. FL0933]|nr:hypothetical protein F5Y07DRAFT_349202 [Xylaria sp. FL0933]